MVHSKVGWFNPPHSPTLPPPLRDCQNTNNTGATASQQFMKITFLLELHNFWVIGPPVTYFRWFHLHSLRSFCMPCQNSGVSIPAPLVPTRLNSANNVMLAANSQK